MMTQSQHDLDALLGELAQEPERFEDLAFAHFYLRPLFDEHIEQNTRAALNYCLQHPRWKLSVQMHKVIGIE